MYYSLDQNPCVMSESKQCSASLPSKRDIDPCEYKISTCSSIGDTCCTRCMIHKILNNSNNSKENIRYFMWLYKN